MISFITDNFIEEIGRNANKTHNFQYFKKENNVKLIKFRAFAYKNN